MLLNGYRQTLGAALVGAAPLNGVYAFYAPSGSSAPSVAATDTLATIIDKFNGITGGGAVRISNATQTAASDGVLFMATTANADVAIDSGKKVYGFGVAHLAADSSRDALLDYNAIPGGESVPANGYVTLLDKISC